MLVEISSFRDAPALSCPATVQFHAGTSSCAARITGVRRIIPGTKTIAVIDTQHEIIATFAQQFLLRNPYPVGVFGGGRILAPIESTSGLKRQLITFATRLAKADEAGRLAAWVDALGELRIDTIQFEWQLGISRENCSQIVAATLARGGITMPVDEQLVSAQTIMRIRGYVLKILTQQAEATEDAWSVQESIAERVRSTGSAAVINEVIEQLVCEQKLVRLNKMIAIASEENLLSKKQKSRMEEIIQLFEEDRTPPTIWELAETFQTRIEAIASLVRFAAQQRVLIELGDGFVVSMNVFLQFCSELRELFDEHAEQSVAAIRDRWQVTRKHAIPLLEYCDQINITIRTQNVRIAGPTLDQFLSEQTID